MKTKPKDRTGETLELRYSKKDKAGNLIYKTASIDMDVLMMRLPSPNAMKHALGDAAEALIEMFDAEWDAAEEQVTKLSDELLGKGEPNGSN